MKAAEAGRRRRPLVFSSRWNSKEKEKEERGKRGGEKRWQNWKPLCGHSNHTKKAILIVLANFPPQQSLVTMNFNSTCLEGQT